MGIKWRNLFALARHNWRTASTGVLLIVALAFLLYWGGLILIGMMLLFGLVTAYRAQDRLLYVPVVNGVKSPSDNPDMYRTPRDWGLPYESLDITTSDGVGIANWLILQANPAAAPTVIYFHGNAGNIGYCLNLFCALHNVCKANVLAVDYRGYGDSGIGGGPTMRGLQKDAQAVLDAALAHPRIDKKKIFVFGSSLGGAVAVDLLSRAVNQGTIAGLILENTFTEVAEMATLLLPPLACFKKRMWLLRLLLRSPWRTIEAIHKIDCPILFISALSDEIIPPTHSASLYAAAARRPVPKAFIAAHPLAQASRSAAGAPAAAAPSPAPSAVEPARAFTSIHYVPGAGHNDTPFVKPATYFATLTSFITGDVAGLMTKIDNHPLHRAAAAASSSATSSTAAAAAAAPKDPSAVLLASPPGQPTASSAGQAAGVLPNVGGSESVDDVLAFLSGMGGGDMKDDEDDDDADGGVADGAEESKSANGSVSDAISRGFASLSGADKAAEGMTRRPLPSPS